MPRPSEFQIASPGLAIWHAFDPSVKADLFSTAVTTPTGLWFVDPIPLHTSALEELVAASKPRGIILTNQNHWRDAARLSAQLAVPIFARGTNDPALPAVRSIADGMKLDDFLEVLTIDGAAPGEIVLYSAADSGTFIIGDALINFEPYGFTFLPPKYCANHRLMRRSLGKLLDRNVERIFFAHGMPIPSNAASPLRDLIQTKRSK